MSLIVMRPTCLHVSMYVAIIFVSSAASSAPVAPIAVDAVSAAQAKLEKEQMGSGQPRTFTEGMAEYRKTAENVKYKSGQDELPGYLYRPKQEGRLPAVIWNHGSEKEPKAQPSLGRFYTEHGYVFFVPIRHGHGSAPGEYIVDRQATVREKETDLKVSQQKQVALHDVYNADVVAAVAWLKEQPFVDPERIIVTGVSYGGIQTMITAEKGLGVKGFVAFAPGAMSYANLALRERLQEAAKNAKAPVLLLQAQNDYSTGPSELLAPILTAKGAPSKSTIYPAFGTTNQEGHGAFATWSLGTAQWGGEVLAFLDSVLQSPPK
jgi:dienelactone hydrolase